LSRLRSNKAELGITAAELGETATYLAHRGASLYYALREIKKGNVVDAVKRLDLTRNPRDAVRFKRGSHSGLKTAAGAWLESRYAVRPLVYDVQSLSDLAQDGINREPFIVSKARKSTPYRERHAHPDESYSSVKQHYWKHRYMRHHTVKLVGKIADSKMDALKALGLDNSWLIAYEAVPFSFILDWFLPFGDYLAAFTGPAGLEFIDGYYSIKVDGKSEYKYHYSVVTSSYEIDRFRSAKFKGDGYERAKLSSFPLPTLPEFENTLGISKALDLGAIFKLLLS
jgi:hypothetical protein